MIQNNHCNLKEHIQINKINTECLHFNVDSPVVTKPATS